MLLLSCLHLTRVKKDAELLNLLFWQSIEDLKHEEVRGCDRHLHLCNAWNIVKRFLSDGKDVISAFDENFRNNSNTVY